MLLSITAKHSDTKEPFCSIFFFSSKLFFFQILFLFVEQFFHRQGQIAFSLEQRGCGYRAVRKAQPPKSLQLTQKLIGGKWRFLRRSGSGSRRGRTFAELKRAFGAAVGGGQESHRQAK
jgi:hypothetical protein